MKLLLTYKLRNIFNIFLSLSLSICKMYSIVPFDIRVVNGVRKPFFQNITGVSEKSNSGYFYLKIILLIMHNVSNSMPVIFLVGSFLSKR